MDFFSNFFSNFDAIEVLYLLPGILIAFAFHEYAHARTAMWLGDDTPQRQGRDTLNPIVHIDIFGLIMIILAGFGWAKPVEVNPDNFRNKKRDDILVSVAGPLANIILAIFFLVLMKITYYLPLDFLNENNYVILMTIFDYAVWINVVLFVFNLLPVPPLDGSHIFFGLMGLKETRLYEQIEQMSTFILLGLILSNLIGTIISPPINLIYDNLFWIFF